MKKNSKKREGAAEAALSARTDTRAPAAPTFSSQKVTKVTKVTKGDGISGKNGKSAKDGISGGKGGLKSGGADGLVKTITPDAPESISPAARREPRPTVMDAMDKTPSEAMLKFRKYQEEAFWSENRIEVWLWSRQIGKSYTLAAWAVYRLLQYPGRLVTILSNSKDNGIEVNHKVAELCEKLGKAFEQVDLSEDATYENMRLETRITINGRVGRIKVLAASPRTARGFSGDLILDEFAFHENSTAIWGAAEPIISSNPDFWCRIASTPNGKYNMFYRLCSGGVLPVRKVPRSVASKLGARIYHPVTGKEISPEEARELAADKAAYDQNYECQFADENMALLTYELIARAESSPDGPHGGILCKGTWTPAAMQLLYRAIGDLEVGVDVGRQVDKTAITVIERVEGLRVVRAQLVLEQMRLPDQQERLEMILRLPKFRRCCIDMTGLGLGLFEYTQKKFGSRVRGINFGTSVPATKRLQAEGRKAESVRVTEAMATELVGVFEDGRIRIPADAELREDLRKPERVVTPGGRVSIAATRTEAGHADRFWSVALAVEAGSGGGPFASSISEGKEEGSFTEENEGNEEGRLERRGGVLV